MRLLFWALTIASLANQGTCAVSTVYIHCTSVATTTLGTTTPPPRTTTSYVGSQETISIYEGTVTEVDTVTSCLTRTVTSTSTTFSTTSVHTVTVTVTPKARTTTIQTKCGQYYDSTTTICTLTDRVTRTTYAATSQSVLTTTSTRSPYAYEIYTTTVVTYTTTSGNPPTTPVVQSTKTASTTTTTVTTTAYCFNATVVATTTQGTVGVATATVTGPVPTVTAYFSVFSLKLDSADQNLNYQTVGNNLSDPAILAFDQSYTTYLYVIVTDLPYLYAFESDGSLHRAWLRPQGSNPNGNQVLAFAPPATIVPSIHDIRCSGNCSGQLRCYNGGGDVHWSVQSNVNNANIIFTHTPGNVELRLIEPDPYYT